MTRRDLVKCGMVYTGIASLANSTQTTALPIGVDVQPFCHHTRRLIEAMNSLGTPLRERDLSALFLLLEHSDNSTTVADIQRILDKYVLLDVRINPESRVSVTRGIVVPELVQHGWSVFLVKVENESGVTARLRAASPQALPDSGQAPASQITATGIVPPGSSRPVHSISDADVMDRWLQLEMFDKPPLVPDLSGLAVEYRIIELYSRDAGAREAQISFDVGPATQDIGFRNSYPVLFHCQAARAVQLSIRDSDRSVATASLTITDAQGRIYPARAKRLAPDFPFQNQIYRADGQAVLLPAGTYTVIAERGPEYLRQTIQLTVRNQDQQKAQIDLKRWIDARQFGWYPGDHHIHAAGCAHYNTPTEGVLPADMAPQLRGEGLCFGEILTWGPCWYYQKGFFRGRIDPTSDTKSFLRYDVEVSGFPSSYWGHLVLLGLKEEEFPGAKEIEQWPTWNLPILRWAKAQGAITGFAHTGHGLTVSSTALPNNLIPEFNDNGANEFLIDVTHGVVDFLSAGDTPIAAELNIWYHALNCGFEVPIAGETDFPCLFEKVGIGRSYVYLPVAPSGDSGYRQWIDGLKHGRSYVSDGRSHILHMSVEGCKLQGEDHHVKLEKPAIVRVSGTVAAYLPKDHQQQADGTGVNDHTYWHIERCRIGNSRRVPVELVVNGRPAAVREVEADGSQQSLTFETPIRESSWVALRILGSSHSNPIYISVQGRPIRASRSSVQWCIDSITAAWQRLGPRIAAHHQSEAKSAREHALKTFSQIMSETNSA